MGNKNITNTTNTATTTTNATITPENCGVLPLNEYEIALLRDIFTPTTVSTNSSQFQSPQNGELVKAFTAVIKEFSTAINNYNNIQNALISIRTDQREMWTAVKELANSNKMIANSITSSSDKNRAQIAAINNERKVSAALFYNSFDSSSRKLWREDMNSRIIKLHFRNGKNVAEIYKDLYVALQKDGYNVYTILDKYGKKYNARNIIEIISLSDILRTKFEAKLDRMWYSYEISMLKESAKSGVELSVYRKTHMVPENIRKMVSALSSTGVPMGRTYSKAMELLTTTKGIDPQKLISQVSKKYNVKNCNFWFAVADDQNLVDALDDVIKNQKVG